MTLAVTLLMQLTSGSHNNPTTTSPEQLTSPLASLPQSKAQRVKAMADTWSGKIAYGAPYSALTPLSTNEFAFTDTRFDPSDDFWGLPRSNGYETVASYCGACHSLAIVMQQRQTTDGWDYLLTWMAEKQGMAPPPAHRREEIITYLAREFGSN